METIEKTIWTSKPALKKMIIATAGKKDEKSFQFGIT